MLHEQIVITMANMILVVFLMILFLTKGSVVASNDRETWYINVNMHKLYKLVEDGAYSFNDKEGTQKVLEKLLMSENINLQFIDKEGTMSRLHSKIKHMLSNVRAKARKGGKTKLLLMNKWQKEDIN